MKDLEKEELRRRESRQRQRERLEDLALVLAKPEGLRVLARLCWELGLGRDLAPEELPAYSQALRLLENVRAAAPDKAAKLLALIYRLEA